MSTAENKSQAAEPVKTAAAFRGKMITVALSLSRRGTGAEYRTLQVGMAWGVGFTEAGIEALGKKEWTFYYPKDSPEAKWEPDYKELSWSKPEAQRRLTEILALAETEQEPADRTWIDLVQHLNKLEDTYPDGIQFVVRSSVPAHPISTIDVELFQVLGRPKGIQSRDVMHDVKTVQKIPARSVYHLTERMHAMPNSLLYRESVIPQIVAAHATARKLDPELYIADEAEVYLYKFLMFSQLAESSAIAELRSYRFYMGELERVRKLNAPPAGTAAPAAPKSPPTKTP